MRERAAEGAAARAGTVASGRDAAIPLWPYQPVELVVYVDLEQPLEGAERNAFSSRLEAELEARPPVLGATVVAWRDRRGSR